MRRRSLTSALLRVNRLLREVCPDHGRPAPDHDDPGFMAWAVQHYGHERLLRESFLIGQKNPSDSVKASR